MEFGNMVHLWIDIIRSEMDVTYVHFGAENKAK